MKMSEDIPKDAKGAAAKGARPGSAGEEAAGAGFPTVASGAPDAPTHIRLYGTVADSIVDGPGLRYAVFVQGCSHGCPGCHNPESHPAEGGTLTAIDALVADIRANGLVHDVTLSGGDPFEQPEACAEVARRLKAAGYGLWAYTGYRYEDLLRQADLAEAAPAVVPGADAEDAAGIAGSADAASKAPGGASPDQAAIRRAAAVRSLLDTVDVLVDGPFVESLKSLGLKWRGSSNQRLIDLAATRAAGQVVEWRPPAFSLEKPSNW